MTKVKVIAGACGFTSVIKATKINKSRVSVDIFSACKKLQGLATELAEVDWYEGVFAKITDSVIYQSAKEKVIHADCPVPSAILKCILIEGNAMLPAPVTMYFEKK